MYYRSGVYMALDIVNSQLETWYKNWQIFCDGRAIIDL